MMEAPEHDGEYELDDVPLPSDALELRIQLKGSKPPVWRRVIVHPDTGMDEMHRIITTLFGMEEGREHSFQAGKEVLRPGGAGYDERRISDLAPGKPLAYRLGDGGGPIFSIKTESDERMRLAILPVLTGGMRGLGKDEGKDPRDIGYRDLLRKLREFRRYDDLVPDREGNMVEVWRAIALPPLPDVYEEFRKQFPEAPLPARKGRTFTPLQPVPDKLPPGTPVELKITLKGMPVPVWRRVVVGSDITFTELHEVIRTAMGWEGYHLYQFKVGDSLIQPFDEDIELMSRTELIDSDLIRLRDLLTGKGWCIEYEYDFGDGWTHRVKAVKVRGGRSTLVQPELLDGAGACPPEDCGGPYGYAGLIKDVNDPGRGDHEMMVEWMGKDRLDPNEFDVGAAKERVATVAGML